MLTALATIGYIGCINSGDAQPGSGATWRNMDKATRRIVWAELSDVLVKHYGDYIRKGSSPDAMVPWSIMQDVRKHLELDETEEQHV